MRLAYAEGSGSGSLGEARGASLADCVYLLFGEFRLTVLRADVTQPRSSGVYVVVVRRYVLQVLGAVICLNPVLVVDFGPGWTRTDERASDHAVNSKLLGGPIAEEAHHFVPVRVGCGAQDTTRADPFPASDSAHAAEITYFIVREVGYRSPLFVHAQPFAKKRLLSFQKGRGIALSLEALRAVDRYGCTQGDRQYRGWAQLPPGEGYEPPPAADMTVDQAAALLAKHSGITAGAIKMDPAVRDIALKKAVGVLHPDRGGDAEEMMRVTRAAAVVAGGK